MKENLRAHQMMMFEMLREVDRICRNHDIKYSLFAGTALGAVRHKGFIPWDDDLDVVMLRPEYNKFLRVASDELDAQVYYLQKECSEHWPMLFSKLRHNSTACIERYIPRDTKTHQGVYVDIFPCDNLSDHVLLRGLQFVASKLVIAKSLDARGYLTNSVLKKALMAVSRALPLESLHRFVKCEGEPNSKMVHTFFGASKRYRKAVYPREWFVETVEMPFEGLASPISAHWDELLTTLYGDYRTPMPENKRGCKVHAEIVDLDHSFEEYIGIQNTMHFAEYTRSIR